jgi:hypothetical protein
MNNLKDCLENDFDSLSYFDNISDKEKEEAFFKDTDTDFHDDVIEKSKDEHFGKVFNFILFIFIFSLMIFWVLAHLKKYIMDMILIVVGK